MRILQVSTHSTLAPRSGGQFRSHHIARCLEEAGHSVSRVAVTWRTEHDLNDPREPIVDVGSSDYWSSPDSRRAGAWMRYLADYYYSTAVSRSPTLREQLRTCVARAPSDVILLEHPWTWPLVRNIPEVRDGTVGVIYSSQNVEAVLKRQMVQDADIDVPHEVLDSVEELERSLVNSARATIACTAADADIFRSWGAPTVITANNGTINKPREHLVGALPLPLQPPHRFALFIGSNYLPNISGFLKYVGPALPRLRPMTRVVSVGSVCEGIDAEISKSPLRYCTDRRLVNLGFVDDVTLDALIVNASALLLPIEYGGGSHLKTAEALASGRPIVGTSTSFRGFTQYQDLPHVKLADTPEQFESAIHAALAPGGSEGVEDFVPRELLWESTLDPIVQLVGTMDAQGPRYDHDR